MQNYLVLFFICVFMSLETSEIHFVTPGHQSVKYNANQNDFMIPREDRKSFIVNSKVICVLHCVLKALCNLIDPFLSKCFPVSVLLQTEARETISRMLVELDLGRTEKCVRVNSVSSGLAEADLQVILQGEVLPPAIMLPKVEDTQEVQWVSYKSWSSFGSSVCFRLKIGQRRFSFPQVKYSAEEEEESRSTCKH